MKIELNKTALENFEATLQTEWLEINDLGSYASSTVYGLNNRRFHGLFNVPAKEPGKKINLLSKFEETVFVKDYSFEISTNQYQKSIYPSGHQYLEKFSLKPFPTFLYVVGNRKIEKTLLLVHDQNLLLVRYTLKNNGDPVKLIIKPIVGGRYTDELVKNIQGINPDSYNEENMVKIVPRADLPELNIYYSRGEYITAPLWYHDFVYNRDQLIGESAKEDLLNPGFFTYDLKPYESLDLFVYIDEHTNFNFEEIYRNEKEYRRKIKPHLQNLTPFAQDVSKKIETISLSQKKSSHLCNLDFYKSECDLREYLLALIGSLIVRYDKDKLNHIIKNLIDRLEDGLLYNENYKDGSGIYADASLLLINLGYHVYKLYNNKDILENIMFKSFTEIIEQYRKGTKFNIYMDKDGLIFSGDKNTNTGFCNLRNDDGSVLRYGKLLEVNTYWINALNLMKYFSEELDKKRLANKYNKLSQKAVTNFKKLFWNSNQRRLFDFVRNDIKDTSFRCNQIIILALPVPILDLKKGQQLLRSIKNELLTPYGLRSLSIHDKKYNHTPASDVSKSGCEYFNGAIHPWSIGDYITACVKYKIDVDSNFTRLKKLLSNFEFLSDRNCLGYFSEVVQGEEPYHAYGQVAFLLNMTEFLRASFYLHMVEKKNK